MLFLTTNLQVNQQVNLMNSYQILRIYLIFFTIMLGDFNARYKSWWPDDIASPEGTDINSLTAMHGLHKYQIYLLLTYYQTHYLALISSLLIKLN